PRSGWRKLLLPGSAGACFLVPSWLPNNNEGTKVLQGRSQSQAQVIAKSKGQGGSQSQNLFRPPLRGYGELLLLCSCKEEVAKKKAGPVANRPAAPAGPLRFSRRWGTARKLASLRHAGL